MAVRTFQKASGLNDFEKAEDGSFAKTTVVTAHAQTTCSCSNAVCARGKKTDLAIEMLTNNEQEKPGGKTSRYYVFVEVENVKSFTQGNLKSRK